MHIYVEYVFYLHQLASRMSVCLSNASPDYEARMSPLFINASNVRSTYHPGRFSLAVQFDGGVRRKEYKKYSQFLGSQKERTQSQRDLSVHIFPCPIRRFTFHPGSEGIKIGGIDWTPGWWRCSRSIGTVYGKLLVGNRTKTYRQCPCDNFWPPEWYQVCDVPVTSVRGETVSANGFQQQCTDQGPEQQHSPPGSGLPRRSAEAYRQ